MINAEVFRLMDLSGGIKDGTNPRFIADNQVQDMRNIDFYRDGDQLIMAKSKGYVKYVPTPPVALSCTGIFSMIRESDATKRNIVCFGDRIYSLEGLSYKYLTSPGKGFFLKQYSDSAFSNFSLQRIDPVINRKSYIAGEAFGTSFATSAESYIWIGYLNLSVITSITFVFYQENGTLSLYVDGTAAVSVSATRGIITSTSSDLAIGLHEVRIEKAGGGNFSLLKTNTLTLFTNELFEPPNYSRSDDLFSYANYIDRIYMQNGSSGKIVWYDGINTGYLSTSPDYVKYIVEFNNHLFVAGTKDDENTLQSSALGNPETWSGSSTISFTIEDKITGLAKSSVYLFIFTEDTVHILTGTDVDTFETTKLSDAYGCVSHHGIVLEGVNLFYPSKDGFYIISGVGAPEKISSPMIDSIYRSISPRRWEFIQGRLIRNQSSIVWTISINGSSSNNAMVVYNYLVGSWSVLDFEMACIGFYRNSLGFDDVFFGDKVGNIYKWGIGYNKDTEKMKSYIKTKPIAFNSVGARKNVWAVDSYYRPRGTFNMNLKFKSDLTGWNTKTFSLYDSALDQYVGSNFKIGSSYLAAKDLFRKQRTNVNLACKEAVFEISHNGLDEDFQLTGMDSIYRTQGESVNGR